MFIVQNANTYMKSVTASSFEVQHWYNSTFNIYKYEVWNGVSTTDHLKNTS